MIKVRSSFMLTVSCFVCFCMLQHWMITKSIGTKFGKKCLLQRVKELLEMSILKWYKWSVPVDRWKVTRRNLNPVFHPRNLEHMISEFNHNSREQIQNLSEHVDGAPVDVLQPFLDLGLKTVSRKFMLISFI